MEAMTWDRHYFIYCSFGMIYVQFLLILYCLLFYFDFFFPFCVSTCGRHVAIVVHTYFIPFG